MSIQDLIIFDTSTLPEYYNDVHKILALPKGHVVTYDYSARHISEAAQQILRALVDPKYKVRAVLAYIQPDAYQKGEEVISDETLVSPTFQTLTRLANVIAVRQVNHNGKPRYYIDLELFGYPYDPERTTAGNVVEALRKLDALPRKTYISVYPDTSINALFETKADDTAFSQVVDALSKDSSQFNKDTFWRIYSITARTKSAWPMITVKAKPLVANVGDLGNRKYSYLNVLDQSQISFHIQFCRGKQEQGKDYRIRKITVDSTPKVTSDLLTSSFWSRSFGEETVSITIPATSSLSYQEAVFKIETGSHEKDERKDYPYGPLISVAVRYRKSIRRSLLAIVSVALSSGLFAWAAFSTSTLTSDLIAGYIVPLEYRASAVVIGVLLSLYAFYLWSDDIALDKVRRG
ncbi:hypothetical protein PQU94_06190 [Asticcacaulis sp. DXS10W]|uniref:Uncharacterized protein n=1 Tax=Asticcacaulis currens TaxID=2984210 RepID=A0ABT5ICG4_9CAUL|nr:hypothetical protein [Asticcacaulis currens]MDC7693870.1 hypothetical protein [Asticcacaulis currens]